MPAHECFDPDCIKIAGHIGDHGRVEGGVFKTWQTTRS